MSDDARRLRRGKQSGLFVEKTTGDLVVASQVTYEDVAMWLVDPMLSEPIFVSSDDFAARYATPR